MTTTSVSTIISAQNHQREVSLFDVRVEERVSVLVCVFTSALMQANLPATLSCRPCRVAQSTSYSRPASPFILCLINDRTLIQSTSEFHILNRNFLRWYGSNATMLTDVSTITPDRALIRKT